MPSARVIFVGVLVTYVVAPVTLIVLLSYIGWVLFTGQLSVLHFIASTALAVILVIAGSLIVRR